MTLRLLWNLISAINFVWFGSLRPINNLSVVWGHSQKCIDRTSKHFETLSFYPILWGKAHVFIGGDFNCGDIEWSTMQVPHAVQKQQTQQPLLDIIGEHCLTQVLNIPPPHWQSGSWPRLHWGQLGDYQGSKLCGFREKDFFLFSLYNTISNMWPRGGTIFDLRGLFDQTW